jgi:insertion element IS1 protein InsB
VDKLLLEKIPFADIARVGDVSEAWLQGHVNRKYAAVPQQVEVSAKKSCLTIQCDEMWSFVGHKGNKQCGSVLGEYSSGHLSRIWLALVVNIQEIVGVYVGNHSEAGLRTAGFSTRRLSAVRCSLH